MELVPNGYYYRLDENQMTILSDYIGDDPILKPLLDDFTEVDGYYYAPCANVDFDEQAAILDAGLVLDMWIYLKSSQWMHG